MARLGDPSKRTSTGRHEPLSKPVIRSACSVRPEPALLGSIPIGSELVLLLLPATLSSFMIRCAAALVPSGLQARLLT